MAQAGAIGIDEEERVIRKAFRRFLWFLFVLYIISFVDRINIGFAALSMNHDLGLTAAAFGLATTFFYIGYVFCEIPSNLMLPRFGARRWIARVMVSWGIMSTATMFATGPWSLYALRFLLGIAEAGFVPGVLLYLTFWFPPTYRARAYAALLVAQPVAVAISSTISGLFLELNGTLGLAGWRWLFLLEGLPAVILGVMVFFFLDDGPANAKWLTARERAALIARLERDRKREETRGTAGPSIRSQLTNPKVVFLALTYLGVIAALNGSTVWTPQIVRGFAATMKLSSVGFIAAVPAVVATVAVLLWGASSDRCGERFWHLRAGLLVAALGWLLVATFSNPAVQLAGLALSSAGGYSAVAIFWTTTASAAILSPAARPVGIALINVAGMCGALTSPLIIGTLKDLSGSFSPGLDFLVVMLLVAAVFVSLVARHAATDGLRYQPSER